MRQDELRTRLNRARAPSARLARLRARPRREGEAAFFYHDGHFGLDAVKLLPGEHFVHDADDLLLTTTLGSCIAACLWDRRARVGGMNHFMLPHADGLDGPAGASGRYGSHAMALLIDQMLERGARRAAIEAKVFGGARLIGGASTLQVGERNTAFVLDYLRTEGVAVVSRDVLGTAARRLCFLPASGKAMVRRLAGRDAGEVLADERAAALRAVGGTVDLFRTLNRGNEGLR